MGSGARLPRTLLHPRWHNPSARPHRAPAQLAIPVFVTAAAAEAEASRAWGLATLTIPSGWSPALVLTAALVKGPYQTLAFRPLQIPAH